MHANNAASCHTPLRRKEATQRGQRAAGSGLKKQISGAYSTRLSGICGIVIVSLVAPCVAAVRGVLRMG